MWSDEPGTVQWLMKTMSFNTFPQLPSPDQCERIGCHAGVHHDAPGFGSTTSKAMV
jgi:hypothetical protein